MHPKTRHKKLLENVRVKRWYENLKARSNLTSDIYLRNLGLWLEWTGLNPDNIIEMARDHLEDFKGKIFDQVRKMETEGKQGSYIAVSLRPLLSYLKFYDVVIRLNLNIKNEERNLTVEQETIPTNEEMDSILQRANLRQRALIGLIAFSGIRPGAIGNYTGDDGLRIGDIIDLKLDKDVVSFEKLPALMIVRAELSKSHKRYYTFIGPQSARYLKEYLNQRIQEGEKLKPESPVIRPDPNMSRLEEPNTFMMSTIAEREIKKAIVKAGFKWRPYVFRHRFGVSLDASEGKGLISHSWRMHIMGHVGDIETTYSTDKPLPDSVIDDMREAFKKCLKNIETEARGISEEDKQSLEKTLTATVLMKIFGYTKEESDKLMELSDEDLQKELQKKLGNASDPESIRRKAMQDAKEMGKRKNKQVMIPIGYVDEYFNQGFEFVSAIGQDKAIMRLPS
ncbi:MAG: site-specific integrase [Thermoplasmataceae archaeon]